MVGHLRRRDGEPGGRHRSHCKSSPGGRHIFVVFGCTSRLSSAYTSRPSLQIASDLNSSTCLQPLLAEGVELLSSFPLCLSLHPDVIPPTYILVAFYHLFERAPNKDFPYLADVSAERTSRSGWKQTHLFIRDLGAHAINGIAARGSSAL